MCPITTNPLKLLKTLKKTLHFDNTVVYVFALILKENRNYFPNNIICLIFALDMECVSYGVETESVHFT
jgi:hypothetical protein